MAQQTSTRVVQLLRAEGYAATFVLREGFEAWLRADGLVESRDSV
jgi:rhodanese-related sulfurtransferase